MLAVFIAFPAWFLPRFFSANMQKGTARTAVRRTVAGLAALIMGLWVLLAVASS